MSEDEMSNVEMSKFGYGLTYFNCNDELVCPECRALEGTLFFSKDAPKMPYDKCTSDFGCRCWAVGIFADDPDFTGLKIAAPDTLEKVLEAERLQTELDDAEMNKPQEKQRSWRDRLFGR